MFEVSFSQASRLNSFFLLVSALLRLVQWFVWALYRVRFVLSFCLFVFPLMGKAEWGGNPVCWWLGLYFCFVCCLDEVSCTGCYWWLGDARSYIQVVSCVWVLTIWYSLGLVLWYSRVLESVLPLLRLKAWSLQIPRIPTIGLHSAFSHIEHSCFCLSAVFVEDGTKEG